MQLEFHQLDRRLEHLRAGNPERQHRLVASLAASGQQSPIVVVESAGRFLVIDGCKRIAALQKLGRDTVEATVWAMSEAEALLLDRTLRLSQQETALEQGWLLREMEQHHGYLLVELARRLDRSVSWVSRRLALVELLPEAIQQQVREGTIAAQLAMKYLVPVARVNVEDCERMAAAFAAHRWNTREAGQLYTAWRGGSRVVRQRILAAPELFLKTQRQPPAPALAQPAATQAAALERDLEMAVAIVERASRRLPEALAEMNGKQRDQVQHKIGQARRELERMAQGMEKEQGETHAEPGTTNGDSGNAPAGSEQTRDRPCVETVAAESVRKVLRSNSSTVPSIFRQEKAEPHRQQILDLLSQCKGNLVRVHEELMASGAMLSYAALTAFCRRQGIGQKPIVPAGRYHFDPGVEMQHVFALAQHLAAHC